MKNKKWLSILLVFGTILVSYLGYSKKFVSIADSKLWPGSSSSYNKTFDHIDIQSDLALIAVVGRGMKATRGTAGRIFAALAHANVNVRMIDQGSSELNIIIGVSNEDFEEAIRAIYSIFVEIQL